MKTFKNIELLFRGSKSRFTVVSLFMWVNMKQSLFLLYYLLTVQTTVNLLLPHPVLGHLVSKSTVCLGN